MQYQSTPPDASEPPPSLQFQQAYPPMALPPTRRRVRWSRVALIAVPVLLCAAILLNIGINVWRILVVPEVHAPLTVGTTAMLKTARGEMVTITITSIEHPRTLRFREYVPLLKAYASSKFSVCQCRMHALRPVAVHLHGPQLEQMAKYIVISLSMGLLSHLKAQNESPMTSTAPVPAISVSFNCRGVTVRSIVCSLASPPSAD